MADWYQKSVEQTTQELGVDPRAGLTDDEARRRLAEYGENALIERGLKSPWKILAEQLTAVLVVILIIAAIVSAMLQDYKDCIVILAIVVLNALIGFRQEYRAERAMAALKRLAVPKVRVKRRGHVCEIAAHELVPGDIVLLEAGTAIPADGRLIDSANLRVEQAALTGESEPVEKDAAATCETETPLADRHNMVFLGTAATYGRGSLIVTDTGMRTELGHIANLMQGVLLEPTPLQRKLDHLGKTLALVVLAIVAAIFLLGLLRIDWSAAAQPRFDEIKLLFLTALSMAVAAVPEGLPAVVTIALALGAQRMLARHALIRKLPAVETLGSVTAICSDKTGTLTRNRMTVVALDVAGHRFDVPESIIEGGASNAQGRQEISQLDRSPTLRMLLAGSALCNDAVLEHDDGDGGHLHSLGDPTESALVLAAARMGLDKGQLEQAMPRTAELPFDSDRKRMTTVHAIGQGEPPAGLDSLTAACELNEGDRLGWTKGAVDGLLDVSNRLWVDDHIESLDATWKERIEAAHNQLAGEGVRVLGVAFRPYRNASAHDGSPVEEDLIFVGIVGMIDPPRSEAAAAVKTCRAAGIRPLMITGDHRAHRAATLRARLGIDTEAHGVLTGQCNSRREPIEELEADRAADARPSLPAFRRNTSCKSGEGTCRNRVHSRCHDRRRCERRTRAQDRPISASPWASPARTSPLRPPTCRADATTTSPRSWQRSRKGESIYDNIRKVHQVHDDQQHRRDPGRDVGWHHSWACRCRCCRCRFSGSISSPTGCPALHWPSSQASATPWTAAPIRPMNPCWVAAWPGTSCGLAC